MCVGTRGIASLPSPFLFLPLLAHPIQKWPVGTSSLFWQVGRQGLQPFFCFYDGAAPVLVAAPPAIGGRRHLSLAGWPFGFPAPSFYLSIYVMGQQAAAPLSGQVILWQPDQPSLSGYAILPALPASDVIVWLSLVYAKEIWFYIMNVLSDLYFCSFFITVKIS